MNTGLPRKKDSLHSIGIVKWIANDYFLRPNYIVEQPNPEMCTSKYIEVIFFPSKLSTNHYPIIPRSNMPKNIVPISQDKRRTMM
mmetsp:Transcript_16968/g.48747  ORF Transcript_16968/g.48747 Transcript_16968/m.48747 type:complete len:85 (+) Transcript_16968:574-828(+)